MGIEDYRCCETVGGKVSISAASGRFPHWQESLCRTGHCEGQAIVMDSNPLMFAQYFGVDWFEMQRRDQENHVQKGGVVKYSS